MDFYQIYIFCALHIKFERNWVSGEQDIHFQKLPNFLHIFLLLLCTTFEEFLNHKQIAFPWFDFLKFGTTIRHIKAYLSSKFGQF